MSKTTRATLALDKAAVPYTAQSYDYDPNAEHIGLHAAESLGVAPEIVLKTLMATVDGEFVKLSTKRKQSFGSIPGLKTSCATCLP